MGTTTTWDSTLSTSCHRTEMSRIFVIALACVVAGASAQQRQQKKVQEECLSEYIVLDGMSHLVNLLHKQNITSNGGNLANLQSSLKNPSVRKYWENFIIEMKPTIRFLLRFNLDKLKTMGNNPAAIKMFVDCFVERNKKCCNRRVGHVAGTLNQFFGNKSGCFACSAITKPLVMDKVLPFTNWFQKASPKEYNRLLSSLSVFLSE